MTMNKDILNESATKMLVREIISYTRIEIVQLSVDGRDKVKISRY